MQFTLKSDGEYEDLDIQKVQFVATLNWKYYYQLTSSFFINFFKYFWIASCVKIGILW